VETTIDLDCERKFCSHIINLCWIFDPFSSSHSGYLGSQGISPCISGHPAKRIGLWLTHPHNSSLDSEHNNNTMNSRPKTSSDEVQSD
jgi:hypothetical protein